MVKKLLICIGFCAGLSGNCALAQENLGYDPRLIGSAPYSDPAFQDYIETSDGYLNSKNTLRLKGGFRDALISPDTPALKKIRRAPEAGAGAERQHAGAGSRSETCVAAKKGVVLPMEYYKVTFSGDCGPIASFVKPLGAEAASPREYVFISILPKEKDYSAMVDDIRKSAGFKFSGEKMFYSNHAKSTMVLGWAQASMLDAIYRNPGVAGLSVEKKSSGIPFKTRVKFTLKVPYQNSPGRFVNRFIKNLGAENGFSAENVFRLPASGSSSKFTAFEVTGSILIDMVEDLSTSPFVASVELKDSFS